MANIPKMLGFALGFILGAQFCEANTTATTESIAVQVVGRAIRDYKKLHEGISPTNWSQLSEVVDLGKLNSQTLGKSPAYPLEQNYVFVTQKIPVPSYPNGDVVLIRTTPVQYEERKLGRYLISMIAGEPSYRWMDETEVQQMLADAGVTELPKPDLPSVSKEPSPATVPIPAQTKASQSAPRDDKQPQVIGQDVSNSSAPKKNQTSGSNTIPTVVGTAVPPSGTSWLGTVVVLGMGFFVAAFLLIRAKQK